MHGLETIRKINARSTSVKPKPYVTYFDEDDRVRTRLFDTEAEATAFRADYPSADLIE